MLIENLTLNQGDTLEFDFEVQDRDIVLPAGWKVLFQIRKFPNAPVVAQCSSTDSSILFIGENKGNVILSNAKTANIQPGVYHWQLEFTDLVGGIFTPLGGIIKVTADITRQEYAGMTYGDGYGEAYATPK